MNHRLKSSLLIGAGLSVSWMVIVLVGGAYDPRSIEGISDFLANALFVFIVLSSLTFIAKIIWYYIRRDRFYEGQQTNNNLHTIQSQISVEPTEKIKQEDSDLVVENETWKRSKWLTGLLWLMLIGTILSIPANYFMSETIIAQYPKTTMPIIYALMIGSVISAISLFAILKNRKWGVWSFCIVVIMAFGSNVHTMGLISALYSLIGVAILFFLLLKGGEKSAWSKLC